MIDGAMTVWFGLTGACLVLLTIDLVRNSPVSWVQKLGWWLVVLYTGPVGFIAFLYACRRPFPGGHDKFTRPVWKQGINSEVHCLAGDATGILVAASLAASLALPAGWELILEYAAGFLSGLFIFQALMMIRMYDGNYLLAVRRTVFAETVSMNFVMIGMLPTMVVLSELWPESREPSQAAFWFRISLGSIAGGITAFPVNRWLVARHLKHGCMTLPGADTPVHASHRSPESPHHMHGGGHEGHEGMHGGHDMHGGGHEGHEGMHGGHDMHGGGHEGHQAGSISRAESIAWVVGSTILLIAVLAVVANFHPISFR